MGQPEPRWAVAGGPTGLGRFAPAGPASSRGAASAGRARAVAATQGLCTPADAQPRAPMLPFPRPGCSSLRVPDVLPGCLVICGSEIAPTLLLRAPARPDGHRSNCLTP